MEKNLGDEFYIWSAKNQTTLEDMLFWNPDRCGYTTNIDNAGIYSAQDADEITKGRVVLNRGDKDNAAREGAQMGYSYAIPVSMINDVASVHRVAKLRS